MIALWPIYEVIQGFVTGGETSKIITNIASIFIILAIAYLFLLRGFPSRLLVHCSIMFAALVALIFYRLTVNGYGLRNVVFDLSPLVRGLGLFVAVFMFMELGLRKHGETFARRFHVLNWTFIAATILFSAVTGVGLATYEKFEAGSKFFFPANNELTFVFALSTLVLVIMAKTIMVRVAVLVSSVIVLLLIGTKSGFGVLALGIVLIAYFELSGRVGILGRYCLLAMVCFAMLFALTNVKWLTDAFVDGLLAGSAGAEKLAEKIEYLGVYSALLSERDVLAHKAISAFMEGGTLDKLLGLGFSNYVAQFTYYESIRFSEIDGLDILGGWGILGILAYIGWGLAIIRYGNIKVHRGVSQYNFAGVVAFLAIVAGNAAGHVFFFSYPMLVLALAVRVTIPNRMQFEGKECQV